MGIIFLKQEEYRKMCEELGMAKSEARKMEKNSLARIILEEAENMQEELVAYRRYLHTHPETGFDLADTKAFVEEKLVEMGYEPQDCGKAGLVVKVGGKKPGKVFLLRGDMDALPVKEEADIDYPSNNGRMHACGHDMHATMLLGAAKLLKAHEEEIEGTIKLMFQPAEEIFQGAQDMINAGVLEAPKVDAGMMLHVVAGMPMQAGTVLVSNPGVSAPAADIFTITIQGKGCHGSMPNLGIDPITVAAHVVLALQNIHARELAISEEAILTIGRIYAGEVANVIPDTAQMSGTIRTLDEDTREFIKTRLVEIVQDTAKTFRAEAEVSFESSCPTLVNNASLCDSAAQYCKELLGEQRALAAAELAAMAAKTGGGKQQKATASEDFSYVSHKIPTVMLAMAAGSPQNGYSYPQHHSKVKFAEEVLAKGSAVYAYNAMRWLEEHK